MHIYGYKGLNDKYFCFNKEVFNLIFIFALMQFVVYWVIIIIIIIISRSRDICVILENICFLYCERNEYLQIGAEVAQSV
jgi:hypothetical protein